MNLDKFGALYGTADSDGVISMDALGGFAAKRFDESVATNPNFYFGPFTGAIARNAGYLFIGRLFANHTSEHPEGILSMCFVPGPISFGYTDLFHSAGHLEELFRSIRRALELHLQKRMGANSRQPVQDPGRLDDSTAQSRPRRLDPAIPSTGKHWWKRR